MLWHTHKSKLQFPQTLNFSSANNAKNSQSTIICIFMVVIIVIAIIWHSFNSLKWILKQSLPSALHQLHGPRPHHNIPLVLVACILTLSLAWNKNHQAPSENAVNFLFNPSTLCSFFTVCVGRGCSAYDMQLYFFSILLFLSFSLSFVFSFFALASLFLPSWERYMEWAEEELPLAPHI